MPMKPIKRGYELWLGVDSSGFINQFQVNTRKVKNIRENFGYASFMRPDMNSG